MKKIILAFSVIVMIFSMIACTQQSDNTINNDKETINQNSKEMTGLEKVNAFLDEAGIWTFVTTDGNQPKARPFGFHWLKDGKLYFATGTFKNVYKQMQKNPLVEVYAFHQGQFLRYDGEVVLVEDKEIENQVLEHSPALKNIYNETTGYQVAVFYLKNAHAEIRSTNELIDDFDVE